MIKSKHVLSVWVCVSVYFKQITQIIIIMEKQREKNVNEWIKWKTVVGVCLILLLWEDIIIVLFLNKCNMVEYVLIIMQIPTYIQSSCMCECIQETLF